MGTPFHADISVPPGSAAGTFPLFDPGTSSVCITYAAFSPDSGPGRFSIFAKTDAAGNRILSGYIGADAGAQRERVWRSKASAGGDASPIFVETSIVCGFEASIDGEYL